MWFGKQTRILDVTICDRVHNRKTFSGDQSVACEMGCTAGILLRARGAMLVHARGGAACFFCHDVRFNFYVCSKVRVPIEAINRFNYTTGSGLYWHVFSAKRELSRALCPARLNRLAVAGNMLCAVSASGEECAHVRAAASDRCKTAPCSPRLTDSSRRKCGSAWELLGASRRRTLVSSVDTATPGKANEDSNGRARTGASSHGQRRIHL